MLVVVKFPLEKIQLSLSLFSLVFFQNCYVGPPPNPNEAHTISKRDTEDKIALFTYAKTVSCGFDRVSGFFFSELGNDEDPNPDARNKKVQYEKKAVNACLTSILSIPCPDFPKNTIQAVDNMTASIVANRFLNCTFEPLKFFEFEKPFSGSLW